MKLKNIIKLCLLVIGLVSCKSTETQKTERSITEVIEIAAAQYDVLFDSVQKNKDKRAYLPRSIRKNGALGFIVSHDWTSGFYPGSLWYLHRLTNDAKWKERAIDYTKRMDSVKFFTGNHDIGFMMECSFGNMIKEMPSASNDSVIVQSAKSLITRFRPGAGIIQSWNSGNKWKCPVIIDNMMNLELLFHASKITGDETYYNVAVQHADNTLKNHFRKDNSSYHVLDYNIETGEIMARNTHQGYSDDSAWSRGQSWGLYGYTVAYRETKNEAYLEQAKKIADFIKDNPNLPEDQVPYWDYNAEKKPDTPRDASAAAITASAMIELSGYVNEALKNEYLNWARTIIRSLSSDDYLAQGGNNKGFILKHSVGSLPHNSEIDTPLNYADYYFLEALYRLGELD